MQKVITFGELMLRLAPENYLRFVQSTKYEATFGGAEANVAVSLANYGADCAFVSKLPAHEIGQAAVNSLRALGVDTSLIVRGGERVGIYYCEKGASQRPSKVIYDRAHSAIAEAKAEEFDWNKIFENAAWFHFTGITPALSDETAKICLAAVKKAKERGVTVSCDVNYRKKLWDVAHARAAMEKLLSYADVCITNESQAEEMFGIPSGDESGESLAEKLVEKFGFRLVALTYRRTINANRNVIWSALGDGKRCVHSRKYEMDMVDRIGGGDAFAAGLIYARLHGFDLQKSADFASAASCLKHSIEGDFNAVSVQEVLDLAGGDASGRVQR